MNYDMNLIQSWLSANKLTLNVKKTKYMLIGSQFKLSQINNDFTVKVNNTPLERVIKHKSLGVQIDESLNWRPHIHTISKKISAGIAILRRVSHFIPFDTRVNMYNALVMPYFNYCGAVWGNINKGTSRQTSKAAPKTVNVWDSLSYPIEFSQDGNFDKRCRKIVSLSSSILCQNSRQEKRGVAHFHFAPKNCQSLQPQSQNTPSPSPIPPSKSVRSTGVPLYADVITKLSRIHGFHLGICKTST